MQTQVPSVVVDSYDPRRTRAVQRARPAAQSAEAVDHVKTFDTAKPSAIRQRWRQPQPPCGR